MFRPMFRLAGSGVLLTLALVACSETSTSPVGSNDLGSPLLAVGGGGTTGVVDTGEFEICKHGTAATFEYSVAGGPVQTVTLADGGCAVLASTEALGPGTVSVTTAPGP